MQLPPSKLNSDDLDRYPPGPTGLARFCEDRVAELVEQREARRTRAERKPINQQLHIVRDLLRFAKSRAGYEPTPEDVGLLDDGDGYLTKSVSGEAGG